MILALKGTERPRRKVVDEQTAYDIVKEVRIAHVEHAADYDRIARYFAGDDIWEICANLWKFCKRDLYYKVESEEVQNVGCPYWILTHGIIDCKNYASFIGGVLDALKRKGYPIVWQYRFVSYRIKSIWDRNPDHVFVVCDPNTDDIWIDPVLDDFNDHLFYWFKTNVRPKTSRVGAIGSVGCGCNTCDSGGAQIGAAAAVNSILADVSAYAAGLTANINQTKTTSVFNSVTEGILLGVAIAVIPGAVIALAALKAGAIALDKAFGVGAASSRIITDISNLNVTALYNDIFNGRTYQTDQYWAAVYYQFYVLGNNITDTNHVSDSDVPTALKWFVDRSGVFISGREHIIGLTQSPQGYEQYINVNPDTTHDMILVNAASLMAKKYWPNPGNFSSSMLGAWKNTIGVYDLGLVQIANAAGQTPEQVAAETGTADQNAANYIATETGAAGNFLTEASVIPNVPNWLLLAGAGVLILSISSKK